MKKSNPEKIIKTTVTKLLKELGILAELSVSQVEDSINVQIESSQSGLLIGYHGETLNALQLMSAMIAYKQLGEWPKLVIEIGDYRQRRQEALTQLAESVAEQVKSTGQAQSLPPMPAFERRIIHLTLANHPDLETFSEGERDRHVVVKLKDLK
jgi:spoIIIJ-associated protein